MVAVTFFENSCGNLLRTVIEEIAFSLRPSIACAHNELPMDVARVAWPDVQDIYCLPSSFVSAQDYYHYWQVFLPQPGIFQGSGARATMTMDFANGLIRPTRSNSSTRKPCSSSNVVSVLRDQNLIWPWSHSAV